MRKQVYPGNKRVGPKRVIMECLPAAAGVSTTSTTLPGSPSLTGDWTLATSETMHGCPTGIDFALGPDLIIMQVGSALSGCLSGGAPLRGTASNASFAFQPAGDFDHLGETNNWAVTISGTLPDGGAPQVTEVWRTQAGLAPGCQNVSEGLLIPRGPACTSHSDCIDINGPCSRCIDGTCQMHPPFCRSSLQ
jgi:hypothetical protein